MSMQADPYKVAAELLRHKAKAISLSIASLQKFGQLIDERSTGTQENICFTAVAVVSLHHCFC